MFKRLLLFSCLFVTTAVGAKETTFLLPSPQAAAYFAAVQRAETIPDARERCLAYPDLPGNEWAEGVVPALCALTPLSPSLDDIEQTLRRPDGGAVLDRQYDALLDAHYKDPEKRDLIFRAYDVFDDSSERAQRLASLWVTSAPDSAYARTARGWQLVAQGWEARGEDLMRDTPRDNVRRMDTLFSQALPDLDFALKQNPRLLPACDRVLSIGASSSEALEETGSALCLNADSASFRVLKSLLWAAQPRWGGSLERMRHIVAMARAREQDNPALAALRSAAFGYEVSSNGKTSGWAERRPQLEQLSRMAPYVEYLQDTSRAMIHLDAYWDAVIYASQAIRFNPENGNAYYDRANALADLGMNQDALTDARHALEYRPHDGWTSYQVGLVLSNLERHEESRIHFRNSMADTETRESANERLCQSYGRAGDMAGVVACTNAMIVDYPGNAEGWRIRALAFRNTGNPEVYTAIDQFFAHVDPASSDDANEVRIFKEWLEENPRPAQSNDNAGGRKH